MKSLTKFDRQLLGLRLGNSLLCFVVCLLIDVLIRSVILV